MSKPAVAIGSQPARKASAIFTRLHTSNQRDTVPALLQKLFQRQQLSMKTKSEPEVCPEAKMRMETMGREANIGRTKNH